MPTMPDRTSTVTATDSELVRSDRASRALKFPPSTLFLPTGPFAGFHPLTYKHYLAMEQDRTQPDKTPMTPLDTFALTEE